MRTLALIIKFIYNILSESGEDSSMFNRKQRKIISSIIIIIVVLAMIIPMIFSAV